MNASEAGTASALVTVALKQPNEGGNYETVCVYRGGMGRRWIHDLPVARPRTGLPALYGVPVMSELLRTAWVAAVIIASYLFFSILAAPQPTERVIDALCWV